MSFNLKKQYSLETALSDLDKDAADATALVLMSQNIKVAWQTKGGKIHLIIDVNDEHRAWMALNRFYDENNIIAVGGWNIDGSRAAPPGPMSSFPSINWKGKLTAVGAVLLLCAIHGISLYLDNHQHLIRTHGTSALYILQGQYGRIITALLLHADGVHLVGNCAALLVLGSVICSIAGPGRGLFLIFSSGAAGNLLNAFMQRQVHLSIGASTAVMGAVGILTAWQIKNKIQTTITPRYRMDISPSALFPLGAGAALVGMFSGGENTDVSAHAFGFMAGIVITFLFAFASSRLRKHMTFRKIDVSISYIDTFFFMITAISIFLAWITR
ncbi:Membrane associated serine protease, rhomboid family [Desulfocicer vacuolatum DSM 3385]|uniref:Membrane associated serine protease, rhomboid family n=1 Tax=Desulfocicer vacuolatum DSM 3385 TaxID=1121400 RepID=A0A1W2EKH0_9BACT|nr:rhomboid family intramembrane serine protease [Desulfocicer vacuolatum]SMD10251.1 Membrane associated serine protease, rhomboid family [Desulfocicer vacuolatum DSM 3385]